jgi:glycine betaine/choline ABC-type transport system substrate-binding protein
MPKGVNMKHRYLALGSIFVLAIAGRSHGQQKAITVGSQLDAEGRLLGSMHAIIR